MSVSSRAAPRPAGRRVRPVPSRFVGAVGPGLPSFGHSARRRGRIALAALVSLPLIPVFTVSLGGGSHLVSCRGPVLTPVLLADDGASIADAVVVRRDAAPTPCNGVTLTARALVHDLPPQRAVARLELVARNRGTRQRNTSVELHIGSRRVLVRLGGVPSGRTTRRVVAIPAYAPVRVQLLLGP